MRNEVTHAKAQEWGLAFVRQYMRSAKQPWGINTDQLDTECYVHLKHCWKSEAPDEMCEILRSLVDAARRGENLLSNYSFALDRLAIYLEQSNDDQRQIEQGANVS